MRFAVAGGGVAGLAAAWDLSSRPGTRLTVFEPGRIGGKLQTSEFAGRPVDEGPDAFIVRSPEAVQLCSELGIRDLVAPAAGRTLLWDGRRLRPIPPGLVLGVPGRLGPVIRSGLLSPAGMVRAGLDLVLPPTRIGEDISVGELVGTRFGQQVARRLVEPLLGGIHAAPLDALSTAVVAPHVLAAARSSRSLLLGLRQVAAGPGTASAGPVFLTPRGGTATLVERLEKVLAERGVEFRSDAVAGIAAAPGTVQVSTTGGGTSDFDGAVLAVPAPAAAQILGPLAPSGLDRIAFTSVALLTAFVPASQWAAPPGFNGLLVTSESRRLMTACSFYTNKWPDPPSEPAGTILRISAGRHGDDRTDHLDDSALVSRLIEEISSAVGTPIRPSATRLSRWPSSFPLYRVGHAQAVQRIHAEITERGGGRLALAGASYGGAGIPACIRSGREAAASVLAGAGG